METKKLVRLFIVPSIVVIALILFAYAHYSLHNETLATSIAITAIVLGSLKLIKDTFESITKGEFALDYIALLAITTGVVTGNYLVALVIVLMLSGGNTLEEYGTARAQKSLTALINRIPNKAILWTDNTFGKEVSIEKIVIGETIAVRKGEVVPLDGILISDEGLFDESSLTGEAYDVEKVKDNTVRSGTINIGTTAVIQVTKISTESTYRKIIDLVERASKEKAPMVRLANRYSAIFTLVTLVVCVLAYLISHDITRVLAVLVVATPCPLILATPIALFGGMNKSAKHNTLVKNPASLEKLARATDIVFDKTGTITMGKPTIATLDIIDTTYTQEKIYSIAEAIERNSLHPFAKTIITEAHKQKVPRLIAKNIEEYLGTGIKGVVENIEYKLSKAKDERNGITLFKGDATIAHFTFEDQIKDGFGHITTQLKALGLTLHIFTGDKKENTHSIASVLKEQDGTVSITADMKPEDKEKGIRALVAEKKVVTMIGDGINDAPALAAADIGMVFSNEEQTASSEAADIIFLHGNLDAVLRSITIARSTVQIALESIIFGIGLSVIAMLFAAYGVIPPVVGAMIQEGIDILVIFNALRASR